MAVKPECRLDNGEVVEYAAAYPLNSKIEISHRLQLIGEGVIYSYDGIKYNGKQRFNFYASKILACSARRIRSR